MTNGVLCGCGCGELVLPDSRNRVRKYIFGHNRRKTKTVILCRNCGKEIMATESRMSSVYCSKECFIEYKSSDKAISIRFWPRVNKNGSIPPHRPDLGNCWEWTGACFQNSGYGLITVKSVPNQAHRVSWELAYGTIPNNLCVLHDCDNRKCVRPDHLFLGTRGENNTDRSQKHRSNPNKTHSDETIRAIRLEVASGKYSIAKLSRKYKISQWYMREIIEGRYRKDVTI